MNSYFIFLLKLIFITKNFHNKAFNFDFVSQTKLTKLNAKVIFQHWPKKMLLRVLNLVRMTKVTIVRIVQDGDLTTYEKNMSVM